MNRDERVNEIQTILDDLVSDITDCYHDTTDTALGIFRLMVERESDLAAKAAHAERLAEALEKIRQRADAFSLHASNQGQPSWCEAFVVISQRARQALSDFKATGGDSDT